MARALDTLTYIIILYEYKAHTYSHTGGFAVSVLSPGDDPIACLNKAMTFLTTVASLRGNNASRLTRVIKCNNCQDEDQLAFLAYPGVLDGQVVQTIIPNNVAFQIEDLDTYDSDCDDISNGQAVLMANISNYGSKVILEIIRYTVIAISFHTLNNCKKHNSKPSDALPVKIKAPKELPKKSLVNESLKKLKFHLAKFNNVVKIRTASNAHTEGE
uniref:Uncharacterized protein n=1 Tax=Tanacetum cinerariifolium TaxID=118510 RepID=A0A699H349_TANCI|nr:hypothetical protein [Tanacetum cinerariifolium]